MDRPLTPSAKRSLGQNFLVDPNALQAIVRHCRLAPGDHIVELGVGLGYLTMALARTGAIVTGLEIDRELIRWISTQVDIPQNVEIRHGDMLDLSLKDLSREFGCRIKIVGNLPYNISTQFLFHLLHQVAYLDFAVLMFQKEVAERIVARPGNKTYGVISVLTAYWLQVERLMELPPQVFRPRPKISSTLLRFKPGKIEMPARDYDFYTLVVKTGFQQRRKKLCNALRSLQGLDRMVITKAMTDCGLDASVRAEVLGVWDFVRLSNRLFELKTALRANDKC